MTGNVVFPYRHAFFEGTNLFLIIQSISRSIWKLLAVWLFFLFLKYPLITFSLNSLQNDILLVGAILKSRTCKPNIEVIFCIQNSMTNRISAQILSNGSLEHLKGSDEHSKGNFRLKPKKWRSSELQLLNKGHHVSK